VTAEDDKAHTINKRIGNVQFPMGRYDENRQAKYETTDVAPVIGTLQSLQHLLRLSFSDRMVLFAKWTSHPRPSSTEHTPKIQWQTPTRNITAESVGACFPRRLCGDFAYVATTRSMSGKLAGVPFAQGTWHQALHLEPWFHWHVELGRQPLLLTY
jgi:hypothetical protein